MQQNPIYVHKRYMHDQSLPDKARLRSTLTYPPNEQQNSPSRLNSYSSAKHFRQLHNDEELFQLQSQNTMLKNQIQELTQNIHNLHQQRQNEIHRYQLEIQRLKKLIEKSYYSIKTTDSEKDDMSTKLSQITKDHEREVKKNTSLQEKLKSMEASWKSSNKIHEHEIRLVWDRVAIIQKNLENVIRVMDQEREEWKKWKMLHSNAPKASNR